MAHQFCGGSSTAGRAAFAVLAVPLLVFLGCGSSDGVASGGDGGGSGSAAGSGGLSGDGGGVVAEAGAGNVGGESGMNDGGSGTMIAAAGAAGSRNDPPGIIASNLPGIDFQVTEDAGAELELISSNFAGDPQSTYVEWFAEIRNHAQKPACFVQAKVDFVGAAGVVIQHLWGFASGDPYTIGDINTVSTCIRPGGSGVVWSNDITSSAVPFAQIQVARVSLSHLDVVGVATPHPATPSDVSANIVSSGPGAWAIKGHALGTAPIHELVAHAFCRASEGWIVAQLSASHAGGLSAGEAWNFDMPGQNGLATPDGLLLSVSFLNGASAVPPP